MEEMRRIAYMTVLRACGFASLAVLCVMIALSFDPHAAFQSGGVLTLMMVAVLLYKAREARSRDHRRTEMWLYLPDTLRPAKATAQQTVSAMMREIYLLFAHWTTIIAIVLLTITLLLSLVAE